MGRSAECGWVQTPAARPQRQPPRSPALWKAQYPPLAQKSDPGPAPKDPAPLGSAFPGVRLLAPPLRTRLLSDQPHPELCSWPRPAQRPRTRQLAQALAPPGRVGAEPASGGEDSSCGRWNPGWEAGVTAMTVLARGSSLLRGLLGRGPALGESAAPRVVSPGTAGRGSAGFRSSGVRYGRCGHGPLSRWPWDAVTGALSTRAARGPKPIGSRARRARGEASLRGERGLAGRWPLPGLGHWDALRPVLPPQHLTSLQQLQLSDL